MYLLIHIVLAVLSIGFSTLSAISPTLRRIKMTLALSAVTVISGFVLVLITHASIVSVCVRGFVFIGIITVLALISKYKLEKSAISKLHGS